MGRIDTIAAVTASEAVKSISERLTVTGYQIPEDALETIRTGVQTAIETGVSLCMSVNVHYNGQPSNDADRRS